MDKHLLIEKLEEINKMKTEVKKKMYYYLKPQCFQISPSRRIFTDSAF